MMELVDMLDLESSAERRGGSTPSTGTKFKMTRIKKEYYNIRFCDASRTIMYDILYKKPYYVTARVTNQRTSMMSKREYFKCKLRGSFDEYIR